MPASLLALLTLAPKMSNQPCNQPSELTIGTRAAALNGVRDSIQALHRARYFTCHLLGWAAHDEKIAEFIAALERQHAEMSAAPMPLGDDRELLQAAS